MERKGQREHLQRRADRALILRAGKAHMPADRHGLLAVQMHEELDHQHGFFAVAIGQAVVDLIERHLLPDTLRIFRVAVVYSIEIHLAEIVEQRTDSDCLLGIFREIVDAADAVTLQIGLEIMIDIQRMLQQAAGIGAVIARACGGCEEIILIREQIGPQTVGTGTLDMGIPDIQKFLFFCFQFLIGHMCIPPFV